MSTLQLLLAGVERRLGESETHYVWLDGGRLHLGTQPPGVGDYLGYFVEQFGIWWFHARLDSCPVEFRLNGRPITEPSTELPRARAEVRMSGEPGRQPRPERRPRHDQSRPRATPKASGRRPARSEPNRSGRREWVIGPPGTGAEIEVDDPQVQVDHARVEVDGDGRWWVTRSRGHVYVGGQQVMSAVVEHGSVFVVGQTSITPSPELLAGGRVPTAPMGDARPPTGTDRGLSVDLSGVTLRTDDTTLLEDVTFSVQPGEVVAIVGPPGSGTSWLMKLLLGRCDPDHGSITVGGARPGRASTQRLVRYVPSSEHMYPELTVAETLTFAARLRDAGATSPAETEARVADALTRLHLGGRSASRVRALSDSERKRLSIGVELVGQPRLLVLDEPAGGLEPESYREVMSPLRSISRDLHCAVIVVTGSVTYLDFADRVVVIAAGGRVDHVGPAARAVSDRGYNSWTEWLAALGRRPSTPAGLPRRPRGRRARWEGPAELSLYGFRAALHRQCLLLVRRGPRWWALLFGIPLAGALIAAMAGGPGLQPGADTTQALAILMSVAALTGSALSYRDLVDDRPVLRRDRRVGVSTTSLVLAKTTTFAAVCVAVAGVLTACYATAGDLPQRAYGVPPGLALFAVLTLVMLASMGFGAVGAAYADSPERALTYQVSLGALQVALNGTLFSLGRVLGSLSLGWVLGSLSLVLPARLGVAALANYAGINRHQDPVWYHNGMLFWLTLAGALVLFCAATGATVTAMERRWSRGADEE